VELVELFPVEADTVGSIEIWVTDPFSCPSPGGVTTAA
jgi:hypothetical protein